MSEAIRKVANLTARKICIHPNRVLKNLSVCLSVTNFVPNYLRIGKTEWAKKLAHIMYTNP